MTTTHQAATTSALGGCCTTADPGAVGGEALEELRRKDETPADVAAVRAAGFRLLLETGRPVTVDDLIDATDVPAARVTEIFDSARARGRVEFDDQDRLIGIAGLTLTPGRHELQLDGATRWTWCALDAVGILGALGATGTVRSTDPQTEAAVEIPFVDGRPRLPSRSRLSTVGPTPTPTCSSSAGSPREVPARIGAPGSTSLRPGPRPTNGSATAASRATWSPSPRSSTTLPRCGVPSSNSMRLRSAEALRRKLSPAGDPLAA